MKNKLYWIKLLNHLEGKGFDSTKDWIGLLDGLNLLDKDYKFEIISGKFGWKYCNIKKSTTNGDFILLTSQCSIEIKTNRSFIKFNGRKRFDDMDEMAKAVHKKCTELFKKLANFEREKKEKEELLEAMEKTNKIESDIKLEEMELLFPNMKISEWRYHYGVISFKLGGVYLQTRDMLSFNIITAPPQNISRDNVKLIVKVYEEVQ